MNIGLQEAALEHDGRTAKAVITVEKVGWVFCNLADKTNSSSLQEWSLCHLIYKQSFVTIRPLQTVQKNSK